MRKGLKDDPTTYDILEHGVHPANRQCKNCKRKLSRYNPNDKCYACLQQELTDKINAPPPAKRKEYTRKYDKVKH